MPTTTVTTYVSIDADFTLIELCQLCGLPAHNIEELMNEGVIDAVTEVSEATVRFRADSVHRVMTYCRLQREFAVNAQSAGLVLDLLDEVKTLRAEAQRLNRMV